MSRTHSDLALTVTTALAAAAATANSTAIDLKQVIAGPLSDQCELYLSVPVTASLVDTKTLIFTVADSADNSSFTAISGLATVTITGTGGTGGVATTQTWRLPQTTRRYVRIQEVTLAAAGDNTAVSFTTKLLV